GLGISAQVDYSAELTPLFRFSSLAAPLIGYDRKPFSCLGRHRIGTGAKMPQPRLRFPPPPAIIGDRVGQGFAPPVQGSPWDRARVSRGRTIAVPITVPNINTS